MCLFTGYGYQVRIIDDLEHVNEDLYSTLEWALAEIRKIQKAARSGGKPIAKPRWPMIVLRTPKVRYYSGFPPFDGKPSVLISCMVSTGVDRSQEGRWKHHRGLLSFPPGPSAKGWEG